MKTALKFMAGLVCAALLVVVAGYVLEYLSGDYRRIRVHAP